jgi:hypothetical protein
VAEQTSQAPGQTDEVAGRGTPGEEEMPRLRFTRGRLVAAVVFVVSVLAFLYFVLPKLLGLHETWNRIQHGNW